MEHLFKSFELKADGDNGTIEGYFSTYEKTPDSYGDIITPGAFTETLKKREETGHPFPLCFNHDFDKIIGVVDSIEEKEHGPYMKGHFLDTELAQDVRKFIKSGAVYQFSFAYDVLENRKPTEDEKVNNVLNVLTKLDLFEVSVVTVPANQNAIITEVKSETPETKAGRRNRKSDEDTIRTIIDLANSLLDDKVDEDPDETEETEEPEEVTSEVNEASEEQATEDNSRKSAESILSRIKTIKEEIDK